MHLIDWIIVAFSLISAGLWGCSALVKWETGFDADISKAVKRTAKLNALAALFAAFATIAFVVEKLSCP